MNGAPLSAFVETAEYVGPALIMEFENGTALCVLDDGLLRWLPTELIKVDIRYDWNKHAWIDVNGVTDDDAEEEPATHGGQTVP